MSCHVMLKQLHATLYDSELSLLSVMILYSRNPASFTVNIILH